MQFTKKRNRAFGDLLCSAFICVAKTLLPLQWPLADYNIPSKLRLKMQIPVLVNPIRGFFDALVAVGLFVVGVEIQLLYCGVFFDYDI